MATTGNRDVALTLSVETVGTEDVKKLQTSVNALAREGGAAAPEFQVLANEIGRLGNQSAALTTFSQLSAETALLSAGQSRAAQSSSDLSTKLTALAAVTSAAVIKQQGLSKEHADAVAEAKRLRDEYDTLSATTSRAGKTAETYTAEVKRLKLAKIEQRAEVERLAAALSAQTAEVKRADAAEVSLSLASTRAADASARSAAALQVNTDAVAKAAQSAQLLGVDTQNVAASQAGLVLSLNNVGKAAAALQADVTKLASAQSQIAAKDTSAHWQAEAAAIAGTSQAVKTLAAQTDMLTASERELRAQAAFAQQVKDAAALRQAAEYVRAWTDELAKSEQQARRTADAAKVVDSAFKTLGTRSVQDLRAEVTRVREAMDTVRASAGVAGTGIAGAMTAGQAQVRALEREIRQMQGALTASDKAAAMFSGSIAQISAGNVVADAVGYLANKVKELGSAFIGAIVGGDQLRRGLQAVYKDAGITASQIDFLRKSSSESGVSFGALGAEFVKFSAAMKGANVPLGQSNDLFKAVTAATAALGLGADATSGTLNALGQMASKGTVSMEELRQQLGDRLPGAMGLTAKGLGITEAQLIKLVESGGLATRDFIVPFTKALGSLGGEADGLVPAFERLKGVLTEVAQGMGDAGATSVLAGALKVLGGFVASLALGFSTLVEGVFLFGSGVTAVAARLMGDAQAFTFFGDQVAKSTARLTSQAAALNTFLDPSAAAAAATTKHTATMTAQTAETVKSINASINLTAAQKLTALSTALSSDATIDASAKFVQYNVASNAMLLQQQAQSDAFGKSAAAAKRQGDTMVELAKLTGDVTLIQQAGVAAAELNVVAQGKFAVSQAAETTILTAQKAKLLESAAARGLTAEQIKVQGEALDKLILKSAAESEQAAQASAAAKATLFERNLAIEQLKNHAGQVDSFKASVESATKTLAEYEKLSLNGKKTDEDVTAARQSLIRATTLYRDALTDSITAIDLETRAKQVGLQMSSAQSTTEQRHAEVLAAQARVMGDSTMATFYDIQAKEASIKVVMLQIKMAALEAEAALKTNEIKRLEIPLGDALRVQKLAVLDIEAAQIKVKLAGNETAKETIAGIENEIMALRNGTSVMGANTGARGASSAAMQSQSDALELLATRFKLSSDYTENEIAALDRLTAANERAAAAENKRLNRDSQLFSVDPATGQRIAVQVDTRQSVAAGAKSQGLTDVQARQVGEMFVSQAGEKMNFAQGLSNGETFSSSVQLEISRLLAKNAAEAERAAAIAAATPAAARGTSPTSPAATTPGGSQSININITAGGKTTAVKVASAADATALTSILRQLEAAAGVSA